MSQIDSSSRFHKLLAIASFVAAVLLAKVFLSILYQYRWYFPADFSSEFLSGRRDSFHGLYRVAFYAHIISSPLVLMVGLFLIITGRRLRRDSIHRWAGRVQAMIVLTVVVPSGLVMACQAFGGAIAGAGFAALAVGTAVCVIMAVRNARYSRFRSHQMWATRCFILLCSALLLRLLSGVVMVMQFEPISCYRINAWISWLMPLIIYEVWWRYSANSDFAWSSASTNEVM
ncbi:MAG: DUF2306 domain-containing protein [Planctomycetaceae bacterium]|nr:DUF2306 domain-containing protein [Planctomycetales bacterium]MCB9874154.1 DUF2306 domain-containing protein [Planctomycetaceae bacterium]